MQKNLKIKQILTHGVEKILPSKEGLLRLMKKRRIRLYLGIDPTTSNLHLGHAVPLRKLREFQDLGHEVILLFGTFTAQIGDPSGRDEKRKPLTIRQIKKNIKTYRTQAAKILDVSKLQIKYNADWLSKLDFKNLIKLASNFTISRLLERNMFQRRLKKGGEVWVNEFLYPLMQGYDSVAMGVDLEIGSNDQLFNMLIGRRLQRIYNKKEKFVLTTPMLIGLDNKEMSQSLGNTVNINDAPREMYGKLMSLKDELIIHYLRLCTNFSDEEIDGIEKALRLKTMNPKDAKEKLAKEIVTIYHGKRKAMFAESEFNKVFKESKLPSRLPKIKIPENNINILDLITKTKLSFSKSEAKRLVLQKGVKINGVVQKDWKKIIKIKKGMVLQVGKRKFIQFL